MVLYFPWLSVPIFNILKYILSSLILGSVFERWISYFLHTIRHRKLLKRRKVPLSFTRGRINRSGIRFSTDPFVLIMIIATAAVLSVEIALELGTDAVAVQPVQHLLTNHTLPYRDVTSHYGLIVPNPPVVSFASDAVTGICHNINGNSIFYYPMYFVHTRLANGKKGVKIECPLNTTGMEYVLRSDQFIGQQNDAVKNVVRRAFLYEEKPAECKISEISYYDEDFNGGIKCLVDLRVLMPLLDFKVRNQSWAFGGTPRPLFIKSQEQTTLCLLITKKPTKISAQHVSSIHACVISSGGWNHVFSVWQSKEISHTTFSGHIEALKSWDGVSDLTYITSVKGENSVQHNLRCLLLVHRNSPEGFQRFSFKGAYVATREGWPDISRTVQRNITVPVGDRVVPAINTWIVGAYISLGVLLILSGLYMGYRRQMSKHRDLIGEHGIASMWLQESMPKIDSVDDEDSKRRTAMLMLIKSDVGDDHVTIVGDEY